MVSRRPTHTDIHTRTHTHAHCAPEPHFRSAATSAFAPGPTRPGVVLHATALPSPPSTPQALLNSQNAAITSYDLAQTAASLTPSPAQPAPAQPVFDMGAAVTRPAGPALGAALLSATGGSSGLASLLHTSALWDMSFEVAAKESYDLALLNG